MTAGRLTGDRIVKVVGGARTLVIGGLVSAAGYVFTVVAPVPSLAFAGFFFIGLGASNIVPVLFTAAGAQRQMPPSLAIAAVTTIGYAGILLGPAAIGHAASLGSAFLLVAAGLVLVAAAGPVSLRR